MPEPVSSLGRAHACALFEVKGRARWIGKEEAAAGGGATLVASDARVQRVVDLFWQDPDNAMDERIYRLLTELSLFGEQFVRYYVEPVTGRVVVRQLDPAYVTEIETDPEDVERVLRYRYQPPSRSLTSSTLNGEGEWIPAGEVSHFALNKVSNALRGRGDLLPV